ncbi:MAG: universal stress protein [Flavobacteriales bacterium]|nr:universal stress protein [Flavobacteriales bacterium]
MINILIPTDFSDNAKQAADFAFTFFNKNGVHFHLVHSVIQPRSSTGMMIDLNQIMLDDADKDLKEEKARLEQKFAPGHPIKTIAKLGYLKDVLKMASREYGAKLIVMGTKGENSLSDKILGSNTEQIIRKNNLPVLAVPAGFVPNKNPNVCVATNEENIPKAEELSAILDALESANHCHFSVLNVLTNGAERAAKSIKLGNMQVGVQAVHAATPEEGIQVYIENKPLDMLVVYHKHNSRFDYFFSRSTTKKLAGQVEIPLLVIPYLD